MGFQTPESAHNFLLTCCSFIQGATVDFESGTVTVDGHKAHVRDYPIAVDASSLRARLRSPNVRRHRDKLEHIRCPYTIVRVDRLDPAKNIVAGFEAFDLLLRDARRLAGKVNFLAFLVPSRQAFPEYRSYKEAVFDAIQKVNERWGSSEWQPIRVSYEDNYDQALAGLALYDTLLVNSLSDGMNLVSKEGALVNEPDGVLVLSRAAGAFHELGDAALPISPTDVPGTADALAAALALPAEERRRRAAVLRRAVEANDFSLWVEHQLADLHKIAVERRCIRRNGHAAGNGHKGLPRRPA